MKITRHQLRRIICEAIDYPAGYEPTNVDKVAEIIQPLLDRWNVGLDRQGEIAMEIADAYSLEFSIPEEAGSAMLKRSIYAMAEDILSDDQEEAEEDWN